MRAAALRAQGPKESESRRSYQHPKLLLRSLHGLAKTQLFRDVATVARGLGLGEVPLAKVGPAGSEQRGNLVYQVYIRRGFQVRGPDRTSRDPKESDFVGALAGKHPTSPVKRNITRRQLINAARQFITDNATAAKQAYDKKWRETSAYQR
jgi:hypothetical protein